MREHTTGADLTGLTAGSMRLAGRPDPSLPQWWRAARWMLGMQLYLGVWFWGVIVFLWLAAVLILSRTPVGVQISYLQFAVHGALWFPFAMMVTVVAAMLTVHVATGMTRRSFLRAAVLTAAAVGLAYGIILAAGLLAESAVYAAVGWEHAHVVKTGDDGPITAPAPWTGGFAVAALTYAVRTFSGAVAGLLVGITYYRFGGWRGTALLPLTVLPALLSQDALAGLLGSFLDLPTAGYSLLALVVPLVGTLAFARLTRSVPIATSRS